MLTISARVDARQVMAALARERKQVPFATALAINAAAERIKPAETKLLASTFEHPRPFTVKSVGLGPRATKTSLVRTVFIKDKTAAYLNPYEYGGSHFIPNRPELGRVILKAVNMPVDAYGQIRKAQLAAILGELEEKRAFFGVVKTKEGDVAGIWQKVIPNQSVSKHFPFIEQGLDLAEYLMPITFAEAFEKAMATAK